MRIHAALAAVAAAAALAAWRLTGEGPEPAWGAAAVIVASRAVAAQAFRLDRLRWRDWTRDDDFIWTVAVLSGSVIAVLSAGALRMELPPAVAAIDALLFLQARLPAAARPTVVGEGRTKARKPALIYGAGGHGKSLLEQLRRSDSGFEPIGWIDDDPDKAEALLSGLPVLGTIRALPFLAELHGVEVVFTAIPGLPPGNVSLTEEMAQMAGIRLCVLPTVRDSLRDFNRDQVAA